MTRLSSKDGEPSFEEALDHQYNQVKAITRVNRLALESKILHSKYADQIEDSNKRMLGRLGKDGDFYTLVEKYKLVVQLNPIKFNNIANGAERYLDRSSLVQGQQQFYLNFFLGPFYKK